MLIVAYENKNLPLPPPLTPRPPRNKIKTLILKKCKSYRGCVCTRTYASRPCRVIPPPSPLEKLQVAASRGKKKASRRVRFVFCTRAMCSGVCVPVYRHPPAVCVHHACDAQPSITPNARQFAPSPSRARVKSSGPHPPDPLLAWIPSSLGSRLPLALPITHPRVRAWRAAAGVRDQRDQRVGGAGAPPAPRHPRRSRWRINRRSCTKGCTWCPASRTCS